MEPVSGEDHRLVKSPLPVKPAHMTGIFSWFLADNACTDRRRKLIERGEQGKISGEVTEKIG
jgi:hypothetical protein